MDQSTALTIRDFQGHEVRTIEYEGETYWVASDACKVLGFNNVSQTVNGNKKTGDVGLDEDEKADIRIPDVTGRLQLTLCLRLSGLFRLMHKSQSPKAKPFQRWVDHDILPAIFATGKYEQPAHVEAPTHTPLQGVGLIQLLSNPVELRATIAFLEESERRLYPATMPIDNTSVSNRSISTTPTHRIRQVRGKKAQVVKQIGEPLDQRLIKVMRRVNQPLTPAKIQGSYLKSCNRDTIRYTLEEGATRGIFFRECTPHAPHGRYGLK